MAWVPTSPAGGTKTVGVGVELVVAVGEAVAVGPPFPFPLPLAVSLSDGPRPQLLGNQNGSVLRLDGSSETTRTVAVRWTVCEVKPTALASPKVTLAGGDTTFIWTQLSVHSEPSSFWKWTS